MTYASYPSLVDRTVFITGGADGIGSAIVQNFAKQGSKVAFVDKNVEYAQRTIERCIEAGTAHVPMFYDVDLLDISALRAACDVSGRRARRRDGARQQRSQRRSPRLA